MPDPLEIINQEEITVKLDAYEALLLLKLVALGISLGIYGPDEKVIVARLMEKFGPGIHEKKVRQLRILRDGLN